MAIEVKFINLSIEAFERGYDSSCWGALDNHIATWPSPTLAAGGTTSVSCSPNGLSALASHAVDLRCTFWHPASQTRFGIWLHCPFQAFHIGGSPYWYVTNDVVADKKAKPASWTKSGADASDEYTFSLPGLPGIEIKAVPTAGHASLSILVGIHNKVPGAT